MSLTRFISLLLFSAVSICAQETTSSPAPVAPDAPAASPKKEIPKTPVTLPGAEAFVYRDGQPDPMRLHVFKPKNWQAADKRPAFVWFFGGGWRRGTPESGVSLMNWASGLGMVAIAPDYRTKERFGTSGLEAVADARAALHWVEEHAAELGIDPERIVVCGVSAGGHLALWTAITHNPPGSNPDEAPKIKPVALILLSAVSDTSVATGYGPERFNGHADELSPVHQLDAKMPPVLMFQGDADEVVPYRQSVALNQKWIDSGNSSEFITVPGGLHSFAKQLPEWNKKTRGLMQQFLQKQNLLPTP